MNIIETILKSKSNTKEIKPGEIITVYPDMVMSHDGDNIYNIKSFEEKFKAKQVYNNNKIVMGLDHNVPSNSLDTAVVHSVMRKFAFNHKITHFYDNEGVVHQLMIENHIEPYQLIFAADSHASSYGGLGALGIPIGTTDNAFIWATGKTWLEVPNIFRIKITGHLQKGVYAKDIALNVLKKLKPFDITGMVIEFFGKAIQTMSNASRVTVCNLSVESGALSAIIDPCPKQHGYYDLHINVSNLRPQVALPHFPSNVLDIEQIDSTRVDQVFLGSCTNGRLEDFEAAALILKGHKVMKDTRFYICPASRKQLSLALNKGYIDALLSGGAILLNPNCSLCFGSFQGVMGDGEVLFSTGNRNHKGRVGSNRSFIYLGSPATAAATAIVGKITDCRDFM